MYHPFSSNATKPSSCLPSRYTHLFYPSWNFHFFNPIIQAPLKRSKVASTSCHVKWLRKRSMGDLGFHLSNTPLMFMHNNQVKAWPMLFLFTQKKKKKAVSTFAKFFSKGLEKIENHGSVLKVQSKPIHDWIAIPS